MEPMLYMLAILGCGDGQTQCQPVRIEPARYASIAACRAATTDALMRSTDLSYPVVVSECRKADKADKVAAAKTPVRVAAR